MEVRITHSLDRTTAAERVRNAARNMDLQLHGDEQPFGGRVVQKTPLGSIEATWEAVEEGEVVVIVVSKPGWLSENAIRKPLEQGLSDALKS